MDIRYGDREISKCWFYYSFPWLDETSLLFLFLFLFSQGKAAEYMERLSTEEVADKCTSILRRFLNDPFVPVAKRCVRTSWYSQPFSRGSYTAMAVGAGQIDIEAIVEPLRSHDDPTNVRVTFAGEHTHTSFYSTVHGAYLTGRRAAQSILESRKTEKQPLSLNCEETSDLSSWIQGISLD